MPAFCEYVWKDTVNGDFHCKHKIVSRVDNKDMINATTHDGSDHGETDEELIINPILIAKSPFGTKSYLSMCVLSDKNKKSYGYYEECVKAFSNTNLKKISPEFSISLRYEMNYPLDDNHSKERNLAFQHFDSCLNANLGIQEFFHVTKNIWQFKTRFIENFDAASHAEACKYTLERLAEDKGITIDWNHCCEYSFRSSKTQGENGFEHIKDTADKLNLSYNIGSKKSSIYIDNDTEIKGQGHYSYTYFNSTDDPYEVCKKIYTQYTSILPEEEVKVEEVEEEEKPSPESKPSADNKEESI